jgi:hypothetical protein
MDQVKMYKESNLTSADCTVLNLGVKRYGGDVLCYITTGTDQPTYIKFSYM